MARSKGSANLAASLEVLAGAPLDAREKVATKADLTASGSFPYSYIGMETYVEAENKKYRLTGADPTDISNWQEVGSGGGGGSTSLSDLTDTDINSPEDGDTLQYNEENQSWDNVPLELNKIKDVAVSNPTAGQVLGYNETTQKFENMDAPSEDPIVNGYAYTPPFNPTGVMDYINWVRAHTDREIKVPNESIFSGKTCNCFYIVFTSLYGYMLFSEYDFHLKFYRLSRSGTTIFNSSRYTDDGTDHVGYNSNGTFQLTNGITTANQVTIKGSSEVDCDFLADPDKVAQIFVSPSVTIDVNNAYADQTTVIENSLAFYTDDTHTTVITPETGKIYVDVPTGNTYEWDGTEYKQIGSKNVPTKTSDLVNDSGFITKAVNDLVNYYLKTETYSKTEVDALVAAVSGMHFEVVSELPTTDIQTNAIYLVPSASSQTANVKDEYINLDGTTAGWEQIGSTAIDLSGYVTTTDLNTALADYTTTANLTTLLAEKQDKAQFAVMPSASIDYAGRIVQYTGVTNSSYTHGYFYECKESDGSYSWVQTNVQSSSGGGGGSYTAGDGITIENNEISIKEMAAADMSEIVTPLPNVGGGSGYTFGIIAEVESDGTVTYGQGFQLLAKAAYDFVHTHNEIILTSLSAPGFAPFSIATSQFLNDTDNVFFLASGCDMNYSNGNLQFFGAMGNFRNSTQAYASVFTRYYCYNNQQVIMTNENSSASSFYLYGWYK